MCLLQISRALAAQTPVMTIRGLHRLLLILGGKASRAFQEEMLIILKRYLDGDHSMVVEIEQNKSISKKHSYESFAKKLGDRAQLYADAELNEMPPTSYVYGTRSEAFPNLINIGRSVNMNARLSSLNTSCAPAPHVIVATAPTFTGNAVRDEALAHTFFAATRKEGEFFESSAEDV